MKSMLGEVRQAKRQYCDHLMGLQNVRLVGVGEKRINGALTGELAVIVGVTKKVPCWQLQPTQQIPKTVGGVRTDVVQVGVIRALQDRTDKWRPCPGGVSIGHKDITAGTFGCLVTRGGEWFILSNNHVLANMNNAEIGDEILQPGKHDGGLVPDDVIATLEDFVRIEPMVDIGDCPVAGTAARVYNAVAKAVGARSRMRATKLTNATNLVDCAIAKPLNPDDVLRDILGVPTPVGHGEAELGIPVVKSGRTTGVTGGTVTQTNATVRVLYGSYIAVFEDQVVADMECGGGDSGSAVLNEDHVVGLLFAGSEDGKTTIFNRAQNVADALGVTFIQ